MTSRARYPAVSELPQWKKTDRQKTLFGYINNNFIKY